MTGFVGGIEDDVANAFDIGGLYSINAKSICGDPLFEFCGPPQVSFNSKLGVGAAGNLIISSAGELLGVDMTDFGYGFSLKTRAIISSNCGQGRGGRIRPILGKVKKSKKVRIIPSDDPNDTDDIIISPLDGGGLPGLNGGGLGGGNFNVLKNTGTSTEDFLGAGGLGGEVVKFELYETLGVNDDFYPKDLGEFADSVYGGANNFWTSLSQSAQGESSLTGGSGTGFKATVRFEALKQGLQVIPIILLMQF